MSEGLERAPSKHMELGRTGMSVPRLGVGAMTWGDPRTFPRWNPARLAYGLAEGEETLREAVDLSIRAEAHLFDTAAMYGKGEAELMLGKVTRGRDVLVATKFPLGFLSHDDQVLDALDASLARLGRTSVDLYQVHFPYPGMKIERLMTHLAKAHQAGKVRAIGVSNFSAEQLSQAHSALAGHGIPLASNQVEYSLFCRKPESNGVLEACRELGVTLIAYMPLASGALTGKYGTNARPTGIRRFMGYFNAKNARAQADVVALLKEIGGRYDKTCSQVALRWLIEQGALPIPGAKNAHQIAQNSAALDFSLTQDEVQSLSDATLAWRR